MTFSLGASADRLSNTAPRRLTPLIKQQWQIIGERNDYQLPISAEYEYTRNCFEHKLSKEQSPTVKRQIGKRHLCNNDRSEKPAFLEIGPNGSGTTAYLDTFYAGRTKCAERRRGLEKERGIPSGSGPEAQLSSVAARTAARFLADAGSPGQFAWWACRARLFPSLSFVLSSHGSHISPPRIQILRHFTPNRRPCSLESFCLLQMV